MKQIIIALVLMFSMSFISAHEIHYNMYGSETIFYDYHQKNNEYLHDHDYLRNYEHDYDYGHKNCPHNKDKFYKYDYRYKFQNNEEGQYHHKYISYLDKWEKTKCYSEPPKGQLFYIKCPQSFVSIHKSL